MEGAHVEEFGGGERHDLLGDDSEGSEAEQVGDTAVAPAGSLARWMRPGKKVSGKRGEDK